jgi:hypothetical protein
LFPILAALALFANVVRAASITVPNHSFELPATTFVSITLDSWQKTPKPDWYVEAGGFTWAQLTGIFRNQPTNSPDHIRNCDGNQALWLFVVPEAGLFQDYNSLGGNDPTPTHAFNTRFEVGKSYHLTVGVIGTGGGMQQGATLELSLYYRDGLSNRVTVAATTATNLITVLSNNTELVDFTVNVPTVRPTDAWANENIGIMLLSTVTTNLQGGYWDLDHVRLVEGPALLNPVRLHQQFQFTLLGEAGAAFEILTSTNSGLSLSQWTSLGTLTNLTGTIPFVDTNASFDQRFYQARQLP